MLLLRSYVYTAGLLGRRVPGGKPIQKHLMQARSCSTGCATAIPSGCSTTTTTTTMACPPRRRLSSDVRPDRDVHALVRSRPNLCPNLHHAGRGRSVFHPGRWHDARRPTLQHLPPPLTALRVPLSPVNTSSSPPWGQRRLVSNLLVLLLRLLVLILQERRTLPQRLLDCSERFEAALSSVRL